MGPNSKLYLSMIDEVFHRNNPEAVTHHVTSSYRSHDPFIDEIAVRGRRGLSELILRELREVRYDVCDVFEQADRAAARFSVGARRPNGTRVVVPGISINRVQSSRLRVPASSCRGPSAAPWSVTKSSGGCATWSATGWPASPAGPGSSCVPSRPRPAVLTRSSAAISTRRWPARCGGGADDGPRNGAGRARNAAEAACPVRCRSDCSVPSVDKPGVAGAVPLLSVV